MEAATAINKTSKPTLFFVWLTSLLIAAVGVLCIAIPAPVPAAEVRMIINRDDTYRILVEGPIQSGDEVKFATVLKKANEAGYIVRSVELRSPGGSVFAGIEIGRQIRKSRLETQAPLTRNRRSICYGDDIDDVTYYPDDHNCICASACALAWFGGVIRSGAVGVHRSFLPEVGGRLSFGEMESILDVSHAEMESFLRDVRVPSTIIDLVLNTSSQELVTLNIIDHPELERDRLYAEYEITECGMLSSQDTNLMWKLFFAHREGTLLSDEQEQTLRALTDAKERHINCTFAAHLRALQEVQLGE